MEKTKLKYKALVRALNALKTSLETYAKTEKWTESEQESFSREFNIYYEDLLVTQRDSLIKRFEFSIEFFWKYLKIYLETVLLFKLESLSPKYIIRTACKAKLISEQDVEQLFEMLKDRNLTSHMYQEEVAQKIAIEVPKHYELLRKCTEKLRV